MIPFLILMVMIILSACTLQAGDSMVGVATDESDPFRLPPAWTSTPWPHPEGMEPTAVSAWISCPDDPEAPLSYVRAGDRVMVSAQIERSIQLRELPSWDESQIVAHVYPGEIMTVIEGPVCWHHLVWWHVQSMESGLEGWTIEGNQMENWLIPVQ